MKKITLIFLLIIFTCSSCQESKQRIKGNWAPMYEKNDSEIYFEMYFNDNKVYYLNQVGMTPSKKYYIDNEYLYIENLDNGVLEKRGKIKFDSNFLIIITDDGYEAKLKKLDSQYTLEKLVKDEIDQDYLLDFFYDRSYEWEVESKMRKPERSPND